MKSKYILWVVLVLVLTVAGLFLLTRSASIEEPEAVPTANNENSTHVPDGEYSLPGNPDRTLSSIQEESQASFLLDKWLKHQNIQEIDPGSNFNIQEFIEALHSNRAGTGEFYRNVLEILKDPSVSMSAKQELIFILSRSATPEAVRFMAEILSRENLSEEIKMALIQQMSMVGEYFWDREDIYQASGAVLALWRETQDPGLLEALASAMGNMGNEISLNALFDAVLSQAGTLEDLRNSDDLRVLTALSGLERVHDPAAAPIVAARLQDSKSSAEMVICADMLASLREAAGVPYLLSWMQTADDSFAPFIPEIFQRISTQGIDYLNSVNLRNLNFRSYQVEQAVLSALGIQ